MLNGCACVTSEWQKHIPFRVEITMIIWPVLILTNLLEIKVKEKYCAELERASQMLHSAYLSWNITQNGCCFLSFLPPTHTAPDTCSQRPPTHRGQTTPLLLLPILQSTERGGRAHRVIEKGSWRMEFVGFVDYCSCAALQHWLKKNL